jgi:hypothetical protein
MNIELLDDPDLLRELRNLQELKREKGTDRRSAKPWYAR